MPDINEIRAGYNARTITIYQAYSSAIALPAIKEQRFIAPFSFMRMTWIKPSFLWLMERSNWAQKSGQEFVLAVRVLRSGWDEALSLGVLKRVSVKLHQAGLPSTSNQVIKPDWKWTGVPLSG